jgi:hypothetical protein
MRPYLAVLKDSFREALASRVLWIVIFLITAALLISAPAGISEEKAARLRRNSVRNWPALAFKIDKQQQADGPSPGKQIWARFSAELQGAITQSLAESPEELPGDVVFELVEELNALLADPAFYDPAAWKDAELGEEAEELLARGPARLKEDEVARLNRLLLRAAYPAEIPREEGSEIQFSYLTFKPFGPLPVTRAELTPAIKIVLGKIVDYAVGGFVVLAAILVTASIIPQTFEPGAIDLLLSKPVSRTVLFLTKFLGGCAFVTLSAAYFIAGLWLIAGTRFGVWSHKLFLCIPVILFLFAVYYSVSALAGVLWRNAIVSVAISIIFWAICLGLWGAKAFVDIRSTIPERLVKLIPADKALLAVDELGHVQAWRAKDSSWEEVFADENLPTVPGGFRLPQSMTGPVYDARRDRLVGIQAPPPGAGGMSLFGPAPTLIVGSRAGGWVRKKGTAAPVGAMALFVSPREDLLVVTRAAIFRLIEEPGPATKTGAKREKFVRAGPEPALRLDPSAVLAQDPDSGSFAIFNRGVLTVLEPDASGTYSRKVEKEVSAAKDAKAALAAIGGKSVLLALPDGRVLILDAASLEVKHEYRPEGDIAPRFVAAAPGGRWLSVLFHNRRLWIYDSHEARAANFWLTGQGNISAAAFAGPDRLLAVDRGKRVTEYQLDPFRTAETRAPTLTGAELGYYYGLVPLYSVFPKPGELGKAVSYLLSDKNEDTLDPRPPDLSRLQDPVDVAGPIWTSLAFMSVTLALSCLYVWRTDF